MIRRYFMLLLASVVLLTSSFPAQAQQSASGRFTGEIDAFSDLFLVTAGIAFGLSVAEVAPEAVIQTGAAVTIDYTLEDGVFTAVRVLPPQTDARGIGRLRGTVEDSYRDTVEIAGKAFDASATDADDDAFKRGARVVIDYASSGGAIVVLRLAVHDPQSGVIAGAVEDFTETTVTINGIVFDLRDAQFADTGHVLEPGALVKVEFSIDDDGTARAAYVDVRSPAPETPFRPRIVLAGMVDAISTDSVTVAGITVDTAAARVDDTVRAGETARIVFRGADRVPTRVRQLDDLDDIDDVIDSLFFGSDDELETPVATTAPRQDTPPVVHTNRGDDDDDDDDDDDGDDD